MLKLGTLAICATTTLALVACQRGGEATGTVQLAMESSSAPSKSIEAVNVDIAGVDVHIAQENPDGEMAGSWLSTNDDVGTINLADLQNHMSAELGELEAYGPITQIRVRFGSTTNGRVVFSDGRSCPVDTSTLPPTGIRVIQPFISVEPDPDFDTRVVLDFDLAASLVEVAPCVYELRPVLRIDRIER